MLDWIFAAVWANYKPFDEFFDLEAGKQAAIIAAYQGSKKIEAVLANEETKKAEQAGRRGRGKK